MSRDRHGHGNGRSKNGTLRRQLQRNRPIGQLIEIVLTPLAEAGILVDHTAVTGDGQIALLEVVLLQERVDFVPQTPHTVDGDGEVAGRTTRDGLAHAAQKHQVLGGRRLGKGMLFLEQSRGGRQGRRRIGLEKGDETGIQRVGLPQRPRQLPVEQGGGLDGLDENQAHDLAQVPAGDHVLERLVVGPQMGAIEAVVPAGAWQNAGPPKHAQFTVDDHILGDVEPGGGTHAELGPSDGVDGEMDGDVGAGAQNERHAGVRVDIGPREQGGGPVIDDGVHVHVQVPPTTGVGDQAAEFVADGAIGAAKAFAHVDDESGVDGGLLDGEGPRQAHGQRLGRVAAIRRVDEAEHGVDAGGHPVEEAGAVEGLDRVIDDGGGFAHDGDPAAAVQLDQGHAEGRPADVDGQKGALLGAGGQGMGVGGQHADGTGVQGGPQLVADLIGHGDQTAVVAQGGCAQAVDLGGQVVERGRTEDIATQQDGLQPGHELGEERLEPLDDGQHIGCWICSAGCSAGGGERERERGRGRNEQDQGGPGERLNGSAEHS